MCIRAFALQAWSDFAWGPVGRYSIHVRVAAIIFIVFKVVSDDIAVPLWLAQDLSALSATRTARVSALDTAFHALRETMFHSKQNRTADPFLVDHMLCQHGQTDWASATAFVNKYNSQVFSTAPSCGRRGQRRGRCLLMTVIYFSEY